MKDSREEIRCKDDETHPYNPDDPNWTPTNLQLRHCIEDLMMMLAICIKKVTEITGEDYPTDVDSFAATLKNDKDEKIH